MARLEPGFKVTDVYGPADGESGTGPLLGSVRALLKEEVGPDTYELVNEYICARLANVIGLPSPPGEFATQYGSRDRYWVSPLVMRESPPPVDPEQICLVEPKAAAGTVVFDTWILNDDRHEDNVIFGSNVGMWLIDHAAALCPKGEDPKAILDQYVRRPLSGHIFSPHVSPNEVSHWCGRIRSVQPQAIKAAIWPTVRYGLIDKKHADAIESFLAQRARFIKELIAPLFALHQKEAPAEDVEEQAL